ncbi:MAG: hypothetical protein M3Q06_07010, partial [Bacteroidota bacterium]|nr:hypothetical protein [Bacteroidota bacterium]
MQGSFEKRVQEKLEELKLTPSEPVWNAIEKELAPPKRRRFPLWIPFVIVLLSGASWWFLSGKEQGASTGTNTVPAGTSLTQKQSETSSHTSTEQNKAVPPTFSPANTSTENRDQRQDKTVSRQQPSLSLTDHSFAANANRYITGKTAAPEKTAAAKAGSDEAFQITPDDTDMSAEILSKGTEPKKTPVQSERDSSVRVQQPVTEQTRSPLTAVVDSAAEKPEEKMTDVPRQGADSAITKKKIAAIQKAWRKTFTLEGGWSRPSSGPLFASGRSRELVYASPSPSSGLNNSVGYGNQSPVNSGAAFRIGAGLAKALGDRWEVSLGLQYAYYSNRSRVGDFKPIDTAFASFNGDVAVSGYYRNNNQQDYTTRLHMLEVPVSLGFKPILRVPLTLAVGALYGRLLHSNALSF